MSRRARKQQSERAPVSGTRFSNERPNQRKKQRGGRRAQERPKSKALLVVVPSEVSSLVPPDSVTAAVPVSAELSSPRVTVAPVVNSAVPSPVAEPPLADEAFLDIERSFFEGPRSSEPAAFDLVVTEPGADDDDDDDGALLLTPEQQHRRQWLRRQVTTLVAGMGAFGAVAMAVRIASLL